VALRRQQQQRLPSSNEEGTTRERRGWYSGSGGGGIQEPAFAFRMRIVQARRAGSQATVQSATMNEPDIKAECVAPALTAECVAPALTAVPSKEVPQS
jgi:hypothetical protein